MIQHSGPEAKPPHEVPSTALREGVGKDLAAFPVRGGGHRGRETPVPIPNTETWSAGDDYRILLIIHYLIVFYTLKFSNIKQISAISVLSFW